jgi:pimeloyl-ACP methyl ester carboxylesterase
VAAPIPPGPAPGPAAGPRRVLTRQGRRLAFLDSTASGPRGASLAGVVFLGGFGSDMTGTKARHLHAWASAQGRAFLRFDYSGHGASGGAFTDGCIGDWATDAAEAIAALTRGPQILVGSSMGGWIALLLARRIPAQVAGIVGIAAAPDFTEDSLWTPMPEAARARLLAEGQITVPSGHSADPLVITRRLIEDGRRHLVLRSPLALPFPVRLLHGTADTDVPVATALRTLDHAEGRDIRLTLVRGADHRFSSPDCLALIEAAIEDVTDRCGRLAG